MKKKIDKSTVIIIGIISAFILFIICMIHYGNRSTENTFQLSEVNDGVYAIYYSTNSRVPAQNYEVITVCCNGNIYTCKGSVQISYVDIEPYATVKQYNLVNSDEVHIYVPKGTVSYEESVNISRWKANSIYKIGYSIFEYPPHNQTIF